MYLRFISILAVFLLTSAALPNLTPRDTRIKINEILSTHVSCQKLNPELIKRAFVNYLDEVDPSKTYLTASEISTWTSPSPELIEQTILEIGKENFTQFEKLHLVIDKAFCRRTKIEEKIANMDLHEEVQASDFKDLSWAKDEEELSLRLLKIRSLQLETAAKLDQVTKDQFMKRLEKRRIKREEEICTQSKNDRQNIVLSLVLKSISGSLDSQTAYFTPSEANQFMIQVQQRLFGIGAQLRDDLNGFTLVRLIEGGPAKESGDLRVNDRIIAVNSVPVVGMDIVEAVELIRGAKGSKVVLTILRDHGDEKEEKLDVYITRDEVVLKETRLEKSLEPFGDGVIGILHLFSFYQDSTTSSTQDLREAINDLKKNHNVKGIILDLRDNAGGLLPEAVTVTGLFIKKGIVVSVKDNTGNIQHLRNIDGHVCWDGPLAILTNKTSASAAEIVAQTLQDYGRAILVGDETTYGKGTFQTFTLESANYGKVNPKGEFKVTRGCYYTVSGKSPQLVGVQTDIVVPGMYSKLEIGEKYSKFPLKNESISANFNDDLSDVPPMHRNQVIRLYKFDLQPVLNTYTSYLEILKKNSAKRLELNTSYQSFIKEDDNKDNPTEPVDNYGLSDFQLIETANIIKDLIFLLSKDSFQKSSVPKVAA